MIDGVRVGHWTDPVARTGCTVVLLPAGTVASAEVRGGAPAARELALLEPGRTVDRVDAVLLTGGSAFGLAAADGVMRWCEERGVGFVTAAGPVPIVPTLAIFDLMVGDGSVRPTADAGYAACVAATADDPTGGTIGAGTGATVGKWQGPELARPGGLGVATASHQGVVATALMVVNAAGDRRVDGELRVPVPPPFLENTTIGVVVTNARASKLDCHLAAQSGHDGFARALDPVHTAGDGDALIVAATGQVDAPLSTLRALTAHVVERAILDAL